MTRYNIDKTKVAVNVWKIRSFQRLWNMWENVLKHIIKWTKKKKNEEVMWYKNQNEQTKMDRFFDA